MLIEPTGRETSPTLPSRSWSQQHLQRRNSWWLAAAVSVHLAPGIHSTRYRTRRHPHPSWSVTSRPCHRHPSQNRYVGGAVRYGILAQHLEQNGWALHNLGSLPHINIAGAISTGTHGSGNTLGGLASSVRALQFIGPTGDLVDVKAGDPGFDGMAVALGAFGPITRVTLAIQPSYRVRQDTYENLPWDRVLHDFDDVMGMAYSVSLLSKWTSPTVEHLWVKSLLSEPVVNAEEYGATRSAVAAADNMNPFGVEGAWCGRLPHFRLGCTHPATGRSPPGRRIRGIQFGRGTESLSPMPSAVRKASRLASTPTPDRGRHPRFCSVKPRRWCGGSRRCSRRRAVRF